MWADSQSATRPGGSLLQQALTKAAPRSPEAFRVPIPSSRQLIYRKQSFAYWTVAWILHLIPVGVR
jgi:hypothetical protein